MTGVTFTNKKGMEDRGYQIKEIPSSSEVLLLKKGKIKARISINEKALLSVEVQNERIENLKWVEVQTWNCPYIILFEMNKDDEIWYCEIPSKGHPVFWS